MRRWAASLIAGVGVAAAAGYFVARSVAHRVDARRNRVLHPGPYQATDAALRLAREAPLTDLHSDALLWDRDLLARNRRGQVDVPRLLQAHVAVQVFSAVTQVPTAIRMRGNRADPDALVGLALLERWPPSAWTHPFGRARYQASRLQRFADASHGSLRVLRTRADLEALLQARAAGKAVVGGVLALEGAQAFEGDLDAVDRLYEAGFRIVGLTHFFDNDVAGSAHGVSGAGLTPFGRTLLRKLEARGMIVDLAHASARTLDDVTAMAKRPVIVSHTGVRATCDSPRNLTDAQLRKVAATGGVIGIGYWKVATCGDDADAIARAIVHALEVVGADHVALGSDFDGAVATPFDVTGVPRVIDALRQRGVPAATLRKVLGGNAVRLLESALPAPVP